MENLICVVRIKFLRVSLLVFILISLAMTVVCARLPDKMYYYEKWMFRERTWEDSGRIYETYFGVKKWKTKLPDISDFMKWRFNKKHLADCNKDYIRVFLIESCKSEFTHWMIIFSTLFFIFWSDLPTTILMFLLASALNLPYIIIQRYNRPRLVRLLRKNSVHSMELHTAKV